MILLDAKMETPALQIPVSNTEKDRSQSGDHSDQHPEISEAALNSLEKLDKTHRLTAKTQQASKTKNRSDSST